MVDVVTYDPEAHGDAWRTFIVEAYKNPNYVLLSPAFLRWQFLDNPANKTGAHTLWVVVHDGVVIAQLGIVPFVGSAPDGERFDGAYPINLIVRPDYQAVGLGAVLMNRLLKETSCVLNPGSSEAGATLCAGLGMQDLGCLRRYVVATDLERAQALATDGRLPSAARVTAAMDETDADAVSPPMRELPDAAPASFAFPLPCYGALRDRTFMTWRYETHPGIAYEFLLSHDLGSVLVFHEEREPTTGCLVLRIVDLLADADAQVPLLAALLREAGTRGAALVDFFTSTPAYDDALRTTGFFREDDADDSRFAALFQPLDFRKTGIRVLASSPGEQSTTFEQWYVTKADSDQDRPNDTRQIVAE